MPVYIKRNRLLLTTDFASFRSILHLKISADPFELQENFLPV